jgi:hypothetical protein
LREIEPISDSQLARHYEGFPFTLIQLFNLMVARFPDLPIADIRDGGTPMTVTVELTTAISEERERELTEFCACAVSDHRHGSDAQGVAGDTEGENRYADRRSVGRLVYRCVAPEACGARPRARG